MLLLSTWELFLFLLLLNFISSLLCASQTDSTMSMRLWVAFSSGSRNLSRSSWSRLADSRRDNRFSNTDSTFCPSSMVVTIVEEYVTTNLKTTTTNWSVAIPLVMLINNLLQIKRNKKWKRKCILNFLISNYVKGGAQSHKKIWLNSNFFLFFLHIFCTENRNKLDQILIVSFLCQICSNLVYFFNTFIAHAAKLMLLFFSSKWYLWQTYLDSL